MNKKNVFLDILNIIWPVALYLLIKAFFVTAVTTFISYAKNARLIIGNLDFSTLASSADVSEMLRVLSYYTTIIVTLVCIPVFYVIYKRDKMRRNENGKKVRLSQNAVGLIVLLGVSLNVSLNNLIYLSGIAFDSEAFNETTASLYSSGLIWELLGAVILAPVAEELIFRGVLYARLKKVFPPIVSAVISGLVFGAIHGNIVQFIYAGIIGIIFAVLVEKYKTIKVSILAHATANFVSIISVESTMFDFMYKNNATYVAITIASCCVAAFIIGNLSQSEKSSRSGF
ncbi:hypothetical protein SAMN05216249_10739 [Acetitomaculum ruminis DSM 5522]|uniref:CAAX prenyl protease 2/Lysostaphin resistance protein A-like domain-containing protein n=1 Tax=Acetitomaculum ruminis DSM 5522 TaxID=1120918 RepID=A0A1I0XR54_9FIRM|nr:type II CAAX endopeptidase family protein [Acetitomaculum ruminis]SFB02423.1 hypothetical protein SAMN05216249_10739 [Acetitomaculum ruminis DSM 5522]